MPKVQEISKNENASDVIDRLEDMIAAWEGAIDDDAVSETKVMLPGGQEIAVTKFGFQDPHLVIVAGRDKAGDEVLVAIPQSQFVVEVTARAVNRIAKVQEPDQEDHVHGFQLPRVRMSEPG
jgi:hypothetical protein